MKDYKFHAQYVTIIITIIIVLYYNNIILQSYNIII
jgi:hypothetical protein